MRFSASPRRYTRLVNQFFTVAALCTALTSTARPGTPPALAERGATKPAVQLTLHRTATGAAGTKIMVPFQSGDALANNQQLPLTATVATAGTYDLEASELAGLNGQAVAIFDAKTGTVTPLEAGQAYRFTVTAGGELRNRFWLDIQPINIVTAQPDGARSR